jgi:hypothetical protein
MLQGSGTHTRSRVQATVFRSCSLQRCTGAHSGHVHPAWKGAEGAAAGASQARQQRFQRVDSRQQGLYLCVATASVVSIARAASPSLAVAVKVSRCMPAWGPAPCLPRSHRTVPNCPPSPLLCRWCIPQACLAASAPSPPSG